MVRAVVRSFLPIGIVLAVAGGAIPIQSSLSQLGLTEAAARELFLGDLRTGGGNGAGDRLVDVGRAAYRKVPEAMRGQVTVGLFQWARAYANSPAVRAAYPGFRTAAMPARKQYPRTVDEEMKKRYDDLVAANSQSRQMAASLPPADRDKLLANLKAMEDLMKSPEGQKGERAAVEAVRAPDKAQDDEAFRVWEERFPADLQQFFARRLREFLAGTAGVDFETRKTTIRGIGGEILGFAEPLGYGDKPWQWREAFLVGPDATAVARAAAEAWLKEIVP